MYVCVWGVVGWYGEGVAGREEVKGGNTAENG